MSRKEKFSRASRRYVQQQDGADVRERLGDGDAAGPDALPPRRKKFPSSRHKIARWYYNLLFVLFVGLIAFLFWFGNTYGP